MYTMVKRKDEKTFVKIKEIREKKTTTHGVYFFQSFNEHPKVKRLKKKYCMQIASKTAHLKKITVARKQNHPYIFL